MEYPNLVTQAVTRMNAGEAKHGACGWVWTFANSDERIAVDEWIVKTAHPLGQLPSTAERRFMLLVGEVFTAAHA